MEIKFFTKVKKNGRLLILFGLGCIFFFSTVLYSEINYDKKLDKVKNEIEDSKKNIDDIQNQIQQKKRDKTKVEKKEQNIAGEIKSLNGKLSKIEKELIYFKEHLLMTKDKIEMINKELKIVQKERVNHLEILKKELYFIYVERLWDISEYDFWAKGLISSKPIADLIKKYEFLKAITRKRLNTFQEAKKSEQLIEKLKKDLMAEKMLSEKIRKETKQKEIVFLDNKKKKVVLRKKLRNKKAAYEKEIKKLEQSAKALQKLVNILDKQTRFLEGEKEKGLLVIQRKGSLSWPIAGRVVSFFGKRKHPQLDTYVINNGIKIKSGVFKEVNNIAHGKVMFADIFQMYGKMIIIDHGGGFYTIYGHLSKLKVSIGKTVKEGEVVGEVRLGSSLYFEVRKNGKPQNPLNWLRKKN